jgi:hypothetical protein
MNEATYRLLEVIGTWLSGIGSLLAVVVALYLARSQSSVKLKVSVGHRLIVTPGIKRESEVIDISVINVGERPVVITNVLWMTGILKRKYAVQITGPDCFSNRGRNSDPHPSCPQFTKPRRYVFRPTINPVISIFWIKIDIE